MYTQLGRHVCAAGTKSRLLFAQFVERKKALRPENGARERNVDPAALCDWCVGVAAGALFGTWSVERSDLVSVASASDWGVYESGNHFSTIIMLGATRCQSLEKR